MSCLRHEPTVEPTVNHRDTCAKLWHLAVENVFHWTPEVQTEFLCLCVRYPHITIESGALKWILNDGREPRRRQFWENLNPLLTYKLVHFYNGGGLR